MKNIFMEETEKETFCEQCDEKRKFEVLIAETGQSYWSCKVCNWGFCQE